MPREKGLGYFGELKRPDGGISTELSIGVNINGKETEVPTLVPTLTKAEINYLLEGNKPTKEIISKAVKHAQERTSQGKSPFAQAPTQPEIKSGYTPPSDIADYIDVGSRDVLERIHKKIIPLTPESKAKLKKEASLAAYGRGGTSEQKQANAMSIYNKLLKERKSKNDSAEIEKINKVNEIRTAKRKAEKEGKLTPVQQFSQASKIVESASYGETIYTERQIKWAKDLITKYTGGAGTQEKSTQEKWWLNK